MPPRRFCIASSPHIAPEHLETFCASTGADGESSFITVGQRATVKDLARVLLQALVFFSLVLGLQWHSGALGSEFGGHPDESAHYVTGLMVRQYLRTWPPASPLKFANDYYLHFPKVALGHWPPFLYVLQAVWSLAFSDSRVSLLLLSTLITTLLGLTIYRVLAAEHGRLVAFICAVLFLALPMIQRYTQMVMADTLLTLLMLWATLLFVCFLESQRWRDAIGFGLCASCAILTKAEAAALALVPVVALCLARRWRLLRTARFWAPVPIVLVLCGPWSWLTRNMVASGWEKQWSVSELVLRMGYYSKLFAGLLGIAILAFSVVGFFSQVVGPIRRQAVQPKWAGLAALVIGVWVMAWFVTSSRELRYLMPALPACLCFAGAGICWIAGRLPSGIAVPRKVAAVSVGLAAVFATTKLAFPTKRFYGFGAAAAAVAQKRESSPKVVLISSDAYGKGEGLFISELAMREPHPMHIVLRASKVLSESSFMGSDYRLLFSTPEEVMRYLESVPVRTIVFDRAASPDSPDHALLARTLQDYPQRWQLVARYDTTRDGQRQPSALEIYRLISPAGSAQDAVQVDMHKVLQQHVLLSK